MIDIIFGLIMTALGAYGIYAERKFKRDFGHSIWSVPWLNADGTIKWLDEKKDTEVK